jgi:hypothetical protein
MKHLFSILLVAISATTFAQGNLQFNQVINVSGVTPGGNVFTTVTVPAEKVWKITSSSWMSPGGGIVAQWLCLGPHSINGSLSGIDPSKLPIWLEPGSYDVKWCDPTGNVSGYRYAISAIEFNVVQ